MKVNDGVVIVRILWTNTMNGRQRMARELFEGGNHPLIETRAGTGIQEVIWPAEDCGAAAAWIHFWRETRSVSKVK